MKFEAIIFDLDGTLWDSRDAVLETWNEVFNKYKDAERVITIDDLKSVMGLQIPDIGKKFFPELDKKYREEILNVCCKVECDVIKKRGGKLYPNLSETLEKLSQKYRLFIVSNCQEGYIESFLEYHKLGKFFEGFKFVEDPKLSKGDNIKILMKKHGITKAVYVGDTQGDLDASKIAGIPFVYAEYGFGNVKSYDYKIDKFECLTNLFL